MVRDLERTDEAVLGVLRAAACVGYIFDVSAVAASLAIEPEAPVPSLRAAAALRRAGHEVLSAANGVQALEVVAAEAPEVVLLDLSMPRMDGWQVLERIRSTRPDLPVVIWSGYNDAAGVERAREAGARAYLPKPVSMPILLEALGDALPD